MVAELQDTRPHDHLCLIYETKEDQSAAFVPFLQAGLVRNEKCFYLTDENGADWVLACMRANDFPVDEYMESGALTIINTHDAYLRDGSFDTDKIMSFWEERLNEAQAQGYSSVRATAEMSWALTKFPGCEM